MHLLGDNVGSYRDNALSAEGHNRDYHIVVAAVYVDIVSALSSYLGNIADISACFLDSSDIPVLCKLLYSSHIEAAACSAGNIVKYYRDIHCVCDSCAMSDKSLLCSLVVVRSNVEQSVSACCLSFL